MTAIPVTPALSVTSLIAPRRGERLIGLTRPGHVRGAPARPRTARRGPDPPEEASPGRALLPGLRAARGEAQPLGHVRPAVGEAGVPRPARGRAVALLQAAQGHRPVDGLEDDGPALLGDGPAVAHVAAHQAGDGVEALRLELVLHAAVGLAEPQHRAVDLEVLSQVLPLTRQDEVAGAGQRVPNQEVAISLHEVFRHLWDKTVRGQKGRRTFLLKAAPLSASLGRQRTRLFWRCFFSRLFIFPKARFLEDPLIRLRTTGRPPTRRRAESSEGSVSTVTARLHRGGAACSVQARKQQGWCVRRCKVKGNVNCQSGREIRSAAGRGLRTGAVLSGWSGGCHEKRTFMQT